MNTTAKAIALQHTLTFGVHQIKTIRREGQVWMSGSEVGRALEYADPETAIKKLFSRNSDEFTSSMTKVVRVLTAGGKQAVRFFSLRGAHLLAMFARTEKAKEFRAWVLDILDREIGALKEAAQSSAQLKESTTANIQYLCNEVHYMVSWWKRYSPGIEAINPHMHNQIFERFLFAPIRVNAIVRDLGMRSNLQEAMAHKWEWIAKKSRQAAKMVERECE